MINIKDESDVQIWCDFQEETRQTNTNFFLRLRFANFRTFLANANNYGSRNGYGNGYGYGDGEGCGSVNNGCCYGDHNGDGYGYGNGDLNGSGIGFGDRWSDIAS